MTRHALALTTLLLLATTATAQQQLGTKIMGGLGIDAGTQAPPGLYLIDRFVQFTATRLRDRTGETLDISGLDVLVRANALGAGYTVSAGKTLRLSAAVGVPFARITLDSDDPFIAIDRLGLGDMLVEPLKVGWQHPRYDVVTSYSLFVPTGWYEPREPIGVGRGHWTQMFSLGGALFSDPSRARRISALMSYEVNGRKSGVDIRRGDQFQIQGGAGMKVRPTIVAGIAGYALWQASDDHGTALPPSLAGARTRTFGLGPEIDITVPKLGVRGELRFEWDFGTRARLQGHVLAAAASYQIWAPSR